MIHHHWFSITHRDSKPLAQHNSFDGTIVTGNQLATGPINGRIIMAKYPPGIVFIFHNCVDCIQSNNSFSQSNPLLYTSIENNLYLILLKCPQAEHFSFALTFPNVFSEIIYTIVI